MHLIKTILVRTLIFILVCGCTRAKFEVGKRNEEKMLRNKGIVTALQAKPSSNKVTIKKLLEVFGVHVDSTLILKEVSFSIKEEEQRGDVTCKLGMFNSYDEVSIPFYEFLPPQFNDKQQYPAIIMFSGHGDMDQVAFEKWTYQKGAGLALAKLGFVVYIMENRGMGMLSNLGDHMKIDAVARLTGGSWYGELITDGLYLVDLVMEKPYVDKMRLGAGGVSTGGALSLFVGAIDERVRAVYVQGYLGSFKTTFGTRSNHHTCNNIAGVLNHFDLADIAGAIAPRNAKYVNGKNDTFYYQDAEKAFEKVLSAYKRGGVPEHVSFEAPDDTIHELSTDIMINFFQENLMDEPSN